MRIIGPPSASEQQVRARLGSTLEVHPRFVNEMLEPLWWAANYYGLDPLGLVALAYKETGAGNFGGQVQPRHYNPGGLKVRHQDLYPELAGDQPLAHAMFANWHNGAQAVAQHVCAYTGVDLPAEEIVDPRYYIVWGVRPPVERWDDFGNGVWNGSPTYGASLVSVARRISAA
jgi:hypothetical protein